MTRKKSMPWAIAFVAIVWAGIDGTSALAGKPGGKPDGGGGKTGPAYQIIDLDDADGFFVDGGASDINNQGRVVGWVEDAILGEQSPAQWSVSISGGSVTSTLALLQPNGQASANAINDNGEIVGATWDVDGTEQALYWRSAGDSPLVLRPLPGDAESFAFDINDNGVICGGSLGDTGTAVAWRVNIVDGKPTVWGPIALGPADSNAASINDNDPQGNAEIAGGCNDFSCAAVWTVRSNHDGTLSVDPEPDILDLFDASGINNFGVVCGSEWPAGELRSAVVWTDSAQVLDCNRRVLNTRATDVSDQGVAVGEAFIDEGGFNEGYRAVVWPTVDGSIVNLNKLVPSESRFIRLEIANAVNEAGEIVGRADSGGFLAIPK